MHSQMDIFIKKKMGPRKSSNEMCQLNCKQILTLAKDRIIYQDKEVVNRIILAQWESGFYKIALIFKAFQQYIPVVLKKFWVIVEHNSVK